MVRQPFFATDIDFAREHVVKHDGGYGDEAGELVEGFVESCGDRGFEGCPVREGMGCSVHVSNHTPVGLVLLIF